MSRTIKPICDAVQTRPVDWFAQKVTVLNRVFYPYSYIKGIIGNRKFMKMLYLKYVLNSCQ